MCSLKFQRARAGRGRELERENLTIKGEEMVEPHYSKDTSRARDTHRTYLKTQKKPNKTQINKTLKHKVPKTQFCQNVNHPDRSLQCFSLLNRSPVKTSPELDQWTGNQFKNKY